MIAILDYDAGNIKSVEKAFLSIGCDTLVTREYSDIKKADHVVLPGVGSFGNAMEHLKRYELDKIIYELIDKQVPFLGICLGLQLLFEKSEESPGVEGLGILKGDVVKFPTDMGLKIPHIGWNDLSYPNEGRLFSDIKENSFVYFVHSYYLKAKDPSVVTATCDYGVNVHASVEKDNIFACQFHPEKSSAVGLQILKNFANI